MQLCPDQKAPGSLSPRLVEEEAPATEQEIALIQKQLGTTSLLYITQTHRPLSYCHSLTHSLSLVLVVMMRSKELKTSRSILMLILRFSLFLQALLRLNCTSRISVRTNLILLLCIQLAQFSHSGLTSSNTPLPVCVLHILSQPHTRNLTWNHILL